MQDSKQLELSLKTLAATIFLGVAGDLLLRDVPWGIGFALYSFVILAVGAYLYRHRTTNFGNGVLYVVPPALLFASLFAWRDSNDLKVLNGTCLVLLVGVLALRIRSGEIAVATLIDYPCRLIGRWFGFLSDFVGLSRLEGGWHAVGEFSLGKRIAAILRGILIAAPILLVFGVLFASSDEVFRVYATRAFSFDSGDATSHLLISIACFWLVGGFFRRLFLATDKPPVVHESPSVLRVGITEITVVLASLNAMFLAFVAIQFRYLFGGHHLVQSTAHLSYADYAHQGFFELVVVAVLGLCVLVAAHSVLKKDENGNMRKFLFLAVTLIGLISVVMASAATRMNIYVEAYGVTRERLYGFAVLLWLVLVLAWFCATTLRQRAERFAAGALGSLFIVVLGLNGINPDRVIARLNTSRSVHRIDGEYLSTLSDDAVPDLLAAISRMPPDAKDKVLASLRGRKKALQRSDWRSWNLAEAIAGEKLSDRHLLAPN